jgi:hypothetical protein
MRSITKMSFQKSRIAKLERIHRTGDELFYLVWGMDEVSAKAMLVEARETGQLGDEDLAICAGWPHTTEPPSPRWVMRKDHFDREVDDALFDLMVKRMEAKWPGLYARWEKTKSEPYARSAASEMTDAELHAAALARPARVLLSVNRAAEPPKR